ncbi:MAG: CsgG/HfaB family protein [Fimbriimonadaceae bacterium]|nr:CsgG/HfaB family protein [Fimbriimonadaceae bacterium]
MKLHFRNLVVLALVASLAGSAAGQKKKDAAPTMVKSSTPVVVLPFASSGEVQLYEIDPIRLGNGLGLMMELELGDRGVTLVDRSYMSSRLKEQGFADMGIVDPSSVAKAGKELGARWQIAVEVISFGENVNNVGGFGFLPEIPGGGQIGVRTSKAKVEIVVKLMDIETSQILAMAKGKGEESKSDVSFGAVSWWRWAARVSFSSDEWLSSRLGRASQKAIADAAEKLAQKWPEKELVPKRTSDGVSYNELFAKKPEAPVSYDSLKAFTYVVVVPETILARPRIPDPAAETEIIKAMINAGLKVKDDLQTKALRDDSAVTAMLHGQVDDAKLHELRTRFGADVLIIGEAVASANNQQIQGQPYTMSRARVEVRAISMDTGDIIGIEDATKPGRDLSDELSGKAALKEAGLEVAPKLLAMMASKMKSDTGSFAEPTVNIELEVGGWASRSDAQEFLEALKDLSGVKSAAKREFTGGTLFADVTVRKSAAEDFAAWLESNSKLKKFGVKIDTDSKGKIKGRAGS